MLEPTNMLNYDDPNEYECRLVITLPERSPNAKDLAYLYIETIQTSLF